MKNCLFLMVVVLLQFLGYIEEFELLTEQSMCNKFITRCEFVNNSVKYEELSVFLRFLCHDRRNNKHRTRNDNKSIM